MADKDKKPSLLETIAFLVVVFIVAAALYKLFTEFWKWATTTKRRAWIDEVIRRSSLPSSAVSVALLGLEMKRVVKQLPGKLFVRNT